VYRVRAVAQAIDRERIEGEERKRGAFGRETDSFSF